MTAARTGGGRGTNQYRVRGRSARHPTISPPAASRGLTALHAGQMSIEQVSPDRVCDQNVGRR
ncbi:MAG: hypothetical protein ACRD0J_02520 [Acidimicrobiales bacterium]